MSPSWPSWSVQCNSPVLCSGLLVWPVPCNVDIAICLGHSRGQCLSAITETSAPVSRMPVNNFPFILNVNSGRLLVIAWTQKASEDPKAHSPLLEANAFFCLHSRDQYQLSYMLSTSYGGNASWGMGHNFDFSCIISINYSRSYEQSFYSRATTSEQKAHGSIRQRAVYPSGQSLYFHFGSQYCVGGGTEVQACAPWGASEQAHDSPSTIWFSWIIP